MNMSLKTFSISILGIFLLLAGLVLYVPDDDINAYSSSTPSYREQAIELDKCTQASSSPDFKYEVGEYITKNQTDRDVVLSYMRYFNLEPLTLYITLYENVQGNIELIPTEFRHFYICPSQS